LKISNKSKTAMQTNQTTTGTGSRFTNNLPCVLVIKGELLPNTIPAEPGETVLFKLLPFAMNTLSINGFPGKAPELAFTINGETLSIDPLSVSAGWSLNGQALRFTFFSVVEPISISIALSAGADNTVMAATATMLGTVFS
jgi:hypothetical protein